MKLRNLLFALTACAALFTACSNEMENAIDNGNNDVENAEAYAAISFTMPNAASTRAGGEIVGTSQENQVNKVVIALFNGDGSLASSYTRTRAQFTPDVVGGSTTYTLKNDAYLAIASEGTYSVHVIVNPTNQTAAFSTLNAYNDYVESVAQKTGEYCTDDNFMMTNANTVSTVAITKTNTKTQPAVITVNVERLAAKIAFDNSGNSTSILDENNTAIGSIVFDAYKVVNTRNSAFGLRRVGTDVTNPTIGGAETSTNYVFENLFAQKATFAEDFYEQNYSRKLTKYVAFRNLNQTTGSALQTIAYCLENTLKERNDQNKGYTTGIILRGKATLKADAMTGTAPAKGDGTFYRYGKTYYASWNDLLTNNSTLNLQKNIYGKEGETDADYKIRISNDKVILYNLGIELYAQGYCYYYYWLIHRPEVNNTDDKTNVGIMEYAIVRNNVYTLKISSVKSIGNFESGTPGAPKEDPKLDQDDVENGKTNPELPGDVADEQEPETPAQPVDPKDPIVDNNMYLKVTIDVNPWTVRQNNIEL